MSWLNDFIFLDYILESKVPVKNKNTGSQYEVKNVDPSKHIRIDQGDIGSFGETEQGKKIVSAITKFKTNATLTSEQRDVLKKHVYTKKDGKKTKYFLVDNGKVLKELDSSSFEALEEAAENKSKSFVMKIESALKKQTKDGKKQNKGYAAETAAYNVLKAAKKNPRALPASWQMKLMPMGLNLNEPYNVVQQEPSVDVKALFGGKTRKGTSKSDIIIKQGDKTFGLSLKYSGSSPATIGAWKPENIKKYLVEQLKLEEKEANEFSGILMRFQGGENDLRNQVGQFFRTNSGKQFLVDQMTKVTQTYELTGDSVATHVAIIDETGGLKISTPIEYVESLQKNKRGSGGCGFYIDVASSGGKVSTKAVNVAEKGEILFEDLPYELD